MQLPTVSALVNLFFSDNDIISCLRKNCKSSHEDILSSVNGIQLTNEQKLRINIVKDHIDYLNNQIIKLNDIIDTLIEPYESYVDLLCTIPGIDRNSAIGILSEISNDMSQFKSHYRLTSWAGLAPGCNESVARKNPLKFLVQEFILNLILLRSHIVLLKINLILTILKSLKKFLNVVVKNVPTLQLLEKF